MLQVTYNLKPQLAALHNTVDGSSWHLCMAGPLYDVRIMSWLARPDDGKIVGDDDSKKLSKVGVTSLAH